MRDIRFRAWDKDRSKMWNTITIESIDFARNRLTVLYDLNITPDGQNSGIYSDTLGRFELMQYTGLKDKKGDEVYEGDVFILDGVHLTVVFEDGKFCFDNTGGSYGRDFLGQDRVGRLIISGNIYEGIKETAVGDRT